MKIVDLSIDFDFFIREDVQWDFGHNEDPEGMYDNPMIWQSRYNLWDLFPETDPRVHADVLPEDLMEDLEIRGFRFDRFQSSREIWSANSHGWAYPFFKPSARVPDADIIVNIDAHHDAWPLREVGVTCENWVTGLHRLMAPSTLFLQAFPRWKPEAEWGRVPIPVQFLPYAQLVAPSHEEWQVRRIFLAQSRSWVPPHHDEAFLRFGQGLKRLTRKPIRCISLFKRTYAPTAQQAAAWHAEHLEKMRRLEQLTLREG